MTDYYPNEWVAIRLDLPDEALYKIFGGWWGGFADGDRWKLNSGVKSVEIDGDHIQFHGYSGSTYHCWPHGYGVRGWRAMQLESLLEGIRKKGVPVEVLPKDTDWGSLVG